MPAFRRTCPRRSPHGERGLKSLLPAAVGHVDLSLSSWRAWIEIESKPVDDLFHQVALLMESVD